jgi:ribonuclease HI
VLISPTDEQYSMVIRLQFKCTNNITKYKPCIHRLETTLERKVERLDVYGDSLLIIYYVKEE